MMNELREIERRLDAAAAQIEGLQALVAEIMSKQRPGWQKQPQSTSHGRPARVNQTAYGSRYAPIQRTQDAAGPANDTVDCTGRHQAFAEFRRPI